MCEQNGMDQNQDSRWALVWQLDMLQRPIRLLPLTVHWTDMAPVRAAAEGTAEGRVGVELHRDAGYSCPESTYAGSWCLFGCSCLHSRPCPWSLAVTLRGPPLGLHVCGPPASVCWTARGPVCPGWDPRKGGTAPFHSPVKHISNGGGAVRRRGREKERWGKLN